MSSNNSYVMVYLYILFGIILFKKCYTYDIM